MGLKSERRKEKANLIKDVKELTHLGYHSTNNREKNRPLKNFVENSNTAIGHMWDLGDSVIQNNYKQADQDI